MIDKLFAELTKKMFDRDMNLDNIYIIIALAIYYGLEFIGNSIDRAANTIASNFYRIK